MPTLTSELVARLKDHISAPANKAGASLDRLKRRAGSAGSAGLFGRMNESATRTARDLLAFGGAAGAAAFAAKGYRDFAAFDRQMTRIGITAEASAGEVANAKKQVRDIANQYGLETSQTIAGLDSLTAAGRNMKDALAFLPSVSATAQASGADVADIAGTADAIGNSMGITADKMQGAFDVLAKAGKAGKFELRDMSQYLPALAPAAAAIGMKGTDGLIKLAAALQMTRNQTGDASSAATNLQNVFQKMTSQETVNKFKKMGVKDLRGQLDKAKKSGKDVFDTFLDITEAATKGDLSKIPLLFNDAQMQAGMRALISQRQQMRELRGELGSAAGTVAGDLAKVQGDAMSGLTKLQNAVGATANAMGEALHKGGVTTFLSELTTELNNASNAIETLSKHMEKGPLGFMDGIHEMNEQAANDPTKKGWVSGKGDPFKKRSKEILADYQRGRPDSTEYNAAQATLTGNRQYFEAIDEGGGPINDEQRAEYAQHKAEDEKARAFIQAEEAKYRANRAALLDQLRQRADAQLQIDHPGFTDPRTKDDSILQMRGGKEVLGPQVPYGFGQKPAAGVPQPPARPAELAPATTNINASKADEAKTKVDAVQAALQQLAVMNANPTVNVTGIDGELAKLRQMKSLIDSINNASVQMPSGRSGHGSYSDIPIE